MLKLVEPKTTRIITDLDKKYWPQERLEGRVEDYARSYPNKEAVVDTWTRLTYKELDKKINDLTINLHEQNIGKDSIVVMQLPNIVESMIVFHAALRVGAIILPITPIYNESEIRKIIDQVEPDIIFTSEYFRNRNYIQMFRNIQELSEVPIIGVKIKNEVDISNNHYTKFNDFITNSANKRWEALPYDEKEYALLMFTSGTTSAPKGVLHTHGTLGVAIDTFDGNETTNENSIFFVPSPVTHITGVVTGLLGPMKKGAKTILMPNWNIEEAYDLIQKEQCTYFMAATPFLTQLIEEVKIRGKAPSSLKYFSCGGADVSEFILKKAKKKMPDCTFSRIYGSTEVPGISTFQKGYSEEKRYSRDGRPTYPGKAKLIDEGSEGGELLVYGPQLFMRYIDLDETKEALDNEWFHSGDLAQIDEDGFVVITGRKKDIIIRGGENYSAKEIEDILITHSLVEDLAIVGFRDEVMGERACVFVVLKDKDQTIKLSDLTDLLSSQKIAIQKWPERLEIVSELPYTHSGKVKKFELRNSLN